MVVSASTNQVWAKISIGSYAHVFCHSESDTSSVLQHMAHMRSFRLLYPIECYQKIPPILLFRPIRLLIFSKKSHLYVYSHLYFYYFYFNCPILLPFKTFLLPILTLDDLRSHFEATIGNLNQKLINCKWIFYWNSKETLLNATKKFHLYFYSDLYVY